MHPRKLRRCCRLLAMDIRHAEFLFDALVWILDSHVVVEYGFVLADPPACESLAGTMDEAAVFPITPFDLSDGESTCGVVDRSNPLYADLLPPGPSDAPVHATSLQAEPRMCRLGIPYWTAPLLYRTCLSRFLRRKRDPAWASSAEGNRTTMVLLLINADCYTVWNCRKVVLQGALTRMRESVGSSGSDPSAAASLLDQELRFSNLVFTKHPKCSDAWSHRRWLVAQKIAWLESDPAGQGRNVLPLLAFAQKEAGVCMEMARRYRRNYFAYTHWRSLLSTGALCKKEQDPARSVVFGWLTGVLAQWSSQKVSDFSALFLRLSMIEYLLSADLLQHELEASRVVIVKYPWHEAQWHFRKGLLCLFFGGKSSQEMQNALIAEETAWLEGLDRQLAEACQRPEQQQQQQLDLTEEQRADACQWSASFRRWILWKTGTVEQAMLPVTPS